MRVYYFNCGHRSKTLFFEKGTHSRLCPVCKNGRIQAVRVYCDDCGIDTGFVGSKTNKMRCKRCAKKRQIKQQMESNNGLPKKEKMYFKRTDCRYYDIKCLPEAAVANRQFDCKDCKHYEPMGLDVMDYVKGSSPIASISHIFSAPLPMRCRR